MNAHDFQFLPQSNGNSSREGVDECTYHLLQTEEESVPVKGNDLHLASPEQELAVASTSMNIGAHICFSLNGGVGESFEASKPLQQQQSPTTPRNEKPSKLRPVLTESTSATTDSVVLKKLLRKSRYFDGDSCLEDRSAGPRAQKSRKLCYLCGQLQHDAKKCPKRRPCYSCKRKGHYAVDCPMNIKESERICLRCGETGHEISSCNSDYSPDDLKKIRCYVCNELGHIFCGSCFDNLSMPTVSCYNCGESGHSGLQCPKPLLENCGSKPPSICYKCGEEGHVARNCIINSGGRQGGASHLGPGTDDGDEHQNNKRARRSKSFKHGRARRRKLRGMVDCMTV
ncbi:hypothetical protein RND81_08G165900 [Saponaria officinalis]|uniref:CCHC-type domain-containing protein n=1 Tax=Saponaria officinalis TaxID=3572 RepID=A0AAW1J7E7_SAPOF